LLERARQLIDQAVVTAQTACEVLTEPALTVAFTKKGVGFLAEPVADLFLSYNLGNEKVRGLYCALTGDEIQKRPFWQSFKALTALRNGVVHRGEPVSPQEARDASQAAADFLAHLEAVAAAP
jgi:hypothetical protein